MRVIRVDYREFLHHTPLPLVAADGVHADNPDVPLLGLLVKDFLDDGIGRLILES
jgi:hypothetical protein